MHIVQAKLGQADDGDNEAKLMTKLAPEWVQTSDPVIRSPACYYWTTAPAQSIPEKRYLIMAFALRDEGRFSVIPTVSRF